MKTLLAFSILALQRNITLHRLNGAQTFHLSLLYRLKRLRKLAIQLMVYLLMSPTVLWAQPTDPTQLLEGIANGDEPVEEVIPPGAFDVPTAEECAPPPEEPCICDTETAEQVPECAAQASNCHAFASLMTDLRSGGELDDCGPAKVEDLAGNKQGGFERLGERIDQAVEEAASDGNCSDCEDWVLRSLQVMHQALAARDEWMTTFRPDGQQDGSDKPDPETFATAIQSLVDERASITDCGVPVGFLDPALKALEDMRTIQDHLSSDELPYTVEKQTLDSVAFMRYCRARTGRPIAGSGLDDEHHSLKDFKEFIQLHARALNDTLSALREQEGTADGVAAVAARDAFIQTIREYVGRREAEEQAGHYAFLRDHFGRAYPDALSQHHAAVTALIFEDPQVEQALQFADLLPESQSAELSELFSDLVDYLSMMRYAIIKNGTDACQQRYARYKSSREAHETLTIQSDGKEYRAHSLDYLVPLVRSVMELNPGVPIAQWRGAWADMLLEELEFLAMELYHEHQGIDVLFPDPSGQPAKDTWTVALGRAALLRALVEMAKDYPEDPASNDASLSAHVQPDGTTVVHSTISGTTVVDETTGAESFEETQYSMPFRFESSPVDGSPHVRLTGDPRIQNGQQVDDPVEFFTLSAADPGQMFLEYHEGRVDRYDYGTFAERLNPSGSYMVAFNRSLLEPYLTAPIGRLLHAAGIEQGIAAAATTIQSESKDLINWGMVLSSEAKEGAYTVLDASGFNELHAITVALRAKRNIALLNAKCFFQHEVSAIGGVVDMTGPRFNAAEEVRQSLENDLEDFTTGDVLNEGQREAIAQLYYDYQAMKWVQEHCTGPHITTQEQLRNCAQLFVRQHGTFEEQSFDSRTLADFLVYDFDVTHHAELRSIASHDPSDRLIYRRAHLGLIAGTSATEATFMVGAMRSIHLIAQLRSIPIATRARMQLMLNSLGLAMSVDVGAHFLEDAEMAGRAALQGHWRDFELHLVQGSINGLFTASMLAETLMKRAECPAEPSESWALSPHEVADPAFVLERLLATSEGPRKFIDPQSGVDFLIPKLSGEGGLVPAQMGSWILKSIKESVSANRRPMLVVPEGTTLPGELGLAVGRVMGLGESQSGQQMVVADAAIRSDITQYTPEGSYHPGQPGYRSPGAHGVPCVRYMTEPNLDLIHQKLFSGENGGPEVVLRVDSKPRRVQKQLTQSKPSFDEVLQRMRDAERPLEDFRLRRVELLEVFKNAIEGLYKAVREQDYALAEEMHRLIESQLRAFLDFASQTSHQIMADRFFVEQDLVDAAQHAAVMEPGSQSFRVMRVGGQSILLDTRVTPPDGQRISERLQIRLRIRRPGTALAERDPVFTLTIRFGRASEEMGAEYRLADGSLIVEPTEVSTRMTPAEMMQAIQAGVLGRMQALVPRPMHLMDQLLFTDPATATLLQHRMHQASQGQLPGHLWEWSAETSPVPSGDMTIPVFVGARMPEAKPQYKLFYPTEATVVGQTPLRLTPEVVIQGRVMVGSEGLRYLNQSCHFDPAGMILGDHLRTIGTLAGRGQHARAQSLMSSLVSAVSGSGSAQSMLGRLAEGVKVVYELADGTLYAETESTAFIFGFKQMPDGQLKPVARKLPAGSMVVSGAKHLELLAQLGGERPAAQRGDWIEVSPEAIRPSSRVVELSQKDIHFRIISREDGTRTLEVIDLSILPDGKPFEMKISEPIRRLIKCPAPTPLPAPQPIIIRPFSPTERPPDGRLGDTPMRRLIHDDAVRAMMRLQRREGGDDKPKERKKWELSSTPISLSAFPNPAREQMTVVGLSPWNTPQIQLLDAMQRVLATYRVDDPGMDNYTISVAQYTPGMYFLRVRDTAGNFQQLKLMVE